jgi:two-component system, chemotaxis family, CheB/CheR fusion protein
LTGARLGKKMLAALPGDRFIMKKSKKLPGDQNASQPMPPDKSFPTVGIGASAGGVAALQAFLQEIPANTGAAYVVIIHLEPAHTSELAEILARKAHIPVQQVNKKMTLQPDNIYVIPPNRRLLISDHEIDSLAFEEPRGRRSPIDQFFRSLADQHGDGFAVVLTGAGSDGAVGAKAIKEAGGLILVQDPDEAEYPSMPRSAIATGLADVVLPVRKLGQELVELIKAKEKVPDEQVAASDEETLQRIFAYLRTRTGNDFSRYKRSTIYRRLARRMQVRQVGELSEYLALLKRKPDEVEALFHELLISVTTFFRDPAAFDVLAQRVIPKLYEFDASAGSLRIWVPGCASGEEAYSLAMLFADEAGRHETRKELQIFASDLDTTALSIAREGRYPFAIEADVGEERLRKYFTKEGDLYRIRRELREMVLFATHSLLKDPPFSRLHLISCRNLLIYLEKDLQQQVLATFNYALRPGGYLFLGSSETADIAPAYFRVLDREARIYQSKGATGDYRELPNILVPHRSGEIPVPGPALGPIHSPPASHQRALELTAPPSILVDINHQIVNMSEAAGRFIQPSGGQIRNDVTELVRPEIRFDLRAALHLAFERNQASLSLPIPVQFNGAPHRVFVQVRPVATGDGNPIQAVIFFIEGDAIEEAEGDKAPIARDQVSEVTIRRLKEELELTRSRLRASREEFEAANEELRASNEELQSINEEYRSTAEELETSKEELQSINEELQTVNAELKLKLEGVSRANNDLQNLMAATDVGTLFLDSDLRIKRFTPRITELFNIKAPDEGRSITDFTHRLDYPRFTEDANAVLKDLKIIEREIGSNGNWYLTRIRPYRTMDDHIEGVVCTFVDVTSRVKIEEALKASEARLRLLLSELSHRVKNTLAVVQSMARQSFSGEVSREAGLEIFANRLRALAEAHNLLVSSDWRGADFRELAERQIGPYAKIDGKTVALEGPPVTMPPDIATPLALVLHELATNALKYGSLSARGGTLRLEWSFKPDGAGRDFQFVWRETGGPKVKPSAKEGFGSWLIQNGLPEAKVSLQYPASGAVCTVTLPGENLNSS